MRKSIGNNPSHPTNTHYNFLNILTMDSEDFKEMREAGRLAKVDKQETAYGIAWDWCHTNNRTIYKIAEHQIRIDNLIDIYPQRNKYHDLKTNTRGTYTDLIQFLNKHFKR